jgi:hypothetical protein
MRKISASERARVTQRQACFHALPSRVSARAAPMATLLCVAQASARVPPPAARAQACTCAPAGIDRLRSSAAAAAAGVLLLCGAPSARAVDFVFASPEAVAGLARRDEAMQFKCKGGMMDCDGDRREYAKKQGESLAKRAAGELENDAACKACAARGYLGRAALRRNCRARGVVRRWRRRARPTSSGCGAHIASRAVPLAPRTPALTSCVPVSSGGCERTERLHDGRKADQDGPRPDHHGEQHGV